MQEKQNRFSIRTLSIGAVSVAIGIWFVSGSQIVKADSISN